MHLDQSRDPLLRFEKYLMQNAYLSVDELEALKQSAQHIVEDGYDVRLGEGRRLCRREYALQVVLNEVHDEEYFVESLKVFDAGAR